MSDIIPLHDNPTYTVLHVKEDGESVLVHTTTADFLNKMGNMTTLQIIGECKKITTLLYDKRAVEHRCSLLPSDVYVMCTTPCSGIQDIETLVKNVKRTFMNPMAVEFNRLRQEAAKAGATTDEINAVIRRLQDAGHVEFVEVGLYKHEALLSEDAAIGAICCLLLKAQQKKKNELHASLEPTAA